MSRCAVLVLSVLLAGVVCLPVDELDMLQELQELEDPVWRFPGGPPPSACEEMTPHHNDTVPQETGSPYRLGAVKLSDTMVEVTVKALGEGFFEGFMLQPRVAHGDPATTGTFVTEDPNVQLMECNHANDTAAHASNQHLQSVTLHWHPPADVADVFFTLTILEHFDTYWVGQVLYWPAD